MGKHYVYADESHLRNYNNYKPFRTKEQKCEAKKTATLRADGAYRSGAGVSFHPAKKELDLTSQRRKRYNVPSLAPARNSMAEGE